MEIKTEAPAFRFTPLAGKIRELFDLKQEEKENLSGIPGGFRYFDRITGGFCRPGLTVIAVRQAMGKTALLLSFMGNIALRSRINMAVFSLERPADKLVRRLVECETGTSVDRIRRKVLNERDQERVSNILHEMTEARIMIDDTNNSSAEEISLHIDMLVETHHPEIIFIDYLDLIRITSSEEQNKEAQYEKILHILRQTAIENNIALVLLHQFVVPGGMTEADFRITADVLPAALRNGADSLMTLNRADYRTPARSFSELCILRHPGLEESRTVALRFIESIDRFVDFE